jgi:hypothetical protein
MEYDCHLSIKSILPMYVVGTAIPRTVCRDLLLLLREGVNFYERTTPVDRPISQLQVLLQGVAVKK